MRRIDLRPKFARTFRKLSERNPELADELESTLAKLAANPFDPSLGTHKLKGKLAGSWSCSLGYDLRLLFDFVPSESGGEDDIFLVNIGTHDEVY